MRNRVSFSYIDDYLTSYDAYANTVFIAYGHNDIYKNSIQYTYLKDDTNSSYIYHDLGRSFIIQKDHTVNLYEQEYERYLYSLTDNLAYHNKKTLAYFPDSNAYFVMTQIFCDPDAYTYSPSFIEGFSGENYRIYKVAYGYNTNSLNSGISNFKTNSYNLVLSDGIHDLSYNMRGKYKVNNTKEYKIIGIGFDESNIPENMFAGVEYDHLINAYVYGSYIENGNVHVEKISNNIDIYNNLNITLPGIEYGYDTGNDDSYSYLSINDNFKQIGNVLVKISLDWHNNKYILYKDLQFSNIVDTIGGFEYLKYFVNGNYTLTNHVREEFLEGDNLTYALLKTIPQSANGYVTAYIGYNNIFKDYTYTSNKENHNPNDRLYSFNLSYYVDEYSNGNGVVATYISCTNGNSHTFEYPVRKLKAENINVSYTINDVNNIVNLNNENNVVTYNEGNIAVDGSFDISTDYPYKFIRTNNTYNVVDVYCKKYNGNNYENIHVNGELSYSSYNTYSFNFNISDGGEYTVAYSLTNGVSNIKDSSIVYITNYNIEETTYNIVTYEGSTYVMFDDPTNYSYNDAWNKKIQTPYSINITTSQFNFNDWQNAYAYIDINNDNGNYVGHIGLCCSTDSDVLGDITGDHVVDVADVNTAINIMLGHDSADNYNGRADVNGDGMIDISDVNSVINYMLGGSDNGVIISPSNNDFFNIYYHSNVNHYNKKLIKYGIKLYKVFTNNYAYINVKPNNIKPAIDYMNQSNIDEHYWLDRYVTNASNYFDISNKTAIDDEKYYKLVLESNIKVSYNKTSANGQSVQDPWPYAYQNFGIQFSDFAYSVSYTKPGNHTTYWTDYANLTNNSTYNISYSLSNESSVSIIIKANNKADVFSYTIPNNSTAYKSDKIKVRIKSKLNNISLGNNNINYWDKLGFSNKYSIYEIPILDTMITINQIDLPDSIFLFTNISDTNLPSYSKRYITTETGTQGNFEKLKFFYNNNEINGISEKFSITQENGIVKFTPYYNNSNSCEQYKLKVTNQDEDTDITKYVTIYLVKVNIEYTNNQLSYIRNGNNILYQEYLLANSNTGSTANDTTFISKFTYDCIDEYETSINLLGNYELNWTDNKLTNILFNIGSDYRNNSNVPNGLKFGVTTSNFSYYQSERVLIPNSTINEPNITLSYLSYNDLSFTNEIKLNEITSISDIKLYTNGEDNYYGQ